MKIGHQLKLNTVPTIFTISACISPMVWWIGRKVRIVIPTTLFDQMDTQQWQWILAHELAHVRRRDYLVRWLEWLTCVCFWWNPVVWWAQRNLRTMEEICCDALVVSGLNSKRHAYAEALMTAIECLAHPTLRTPAMASKINNGGFLEKRFKTIVSPTSTRKTSRWLQACVLLCAIVILSLGLVYARNDAASRPKEQTHVGMLEHVNNNGQIELVAHGKTTWLTVTSTTQAKNVDGSAADTEDFIGQKVNVISVDSKVVSVEGLEERISGMSEDELALARRFYELKEALESGRIARTDVRKLFEALGITWKQGNDMLERVEKEYSQNPLDKDQDDYSQELIQHAVVSGAMTKKEGDLAIEFSELYQALKSRKLDREKAAIWLEKLGITWREGEILLKKVRAVSRSPLDGRYAE